MSARRTLVIRGAVAVAVAGAIAAGALAFVSADGDGGSEVPTYTVTETSFRREVPADGTLEAIDTTPITAPQDARMPLKVAWLVDDGTRVEKGDVVIRFDPTEMKELLHNGHQSTEQAQNRIGKETAVSGSAQRKRDREAAMAESEMQAAEEFESVDDEVFSRNEIIESQIDVDLAAAKMKHAKKVKKIERSVSAGKLQVLEVQKRQAQMLVDRAEGALSQLELTAPHGGIVLLRRDWHGKVLAVGDTVWPGQNLAEVPADASLQAEVFVLEADGGSLAEDMEASVVVESAPGRTYDGKIKRVDTLAKPRNPEVPVQYFAVVIELDETDREVMKIGARVRATILQGEEDALVVPRQAVFTRGGDQFVYRKTATGGFERVAVTLGTSTPGRVVISVGLEAGDEIALRDPGIGEGPEDAGPGGEREPDGGKKAAAIEGGDEEHVNAPR